ncbi:ribosome small subunit-dependent GTPase A [Denitrobaculum tricleocarpae]|uniref:Small ribosomal subunit biogenesis GTPase RsgA n=1 Tax=Denitrobaculum tricleocarpae TaxID=2591009 RepID=A0A545TYF5_9PROT|nr:ribosome small subunit-dependent GTPase A [Denitrobaculum tricleocarpae]TQV82203.1 ribosome small subunit-dependent GTPase A [Denitrobaculum tricleocarpae]
MTRDYSQFFSSSLQGAGSERPLSKIESLGWQPFFAQQISVEEMAQMPPVRVVEVHRSALHVIGDDIDQTIPSRPDVTVGDWLLLDSKLPASSRLLERKSLLKRRAPGTDRQLQLIAANIDTAFIVSSCNQDFNIARLERYVALAFEAEITPVIVLTKADLTSASEDYLAQAEAISDRVAVVTLDARGEEPKVKLGEWCKPGQTLACLGSSGVGKSTLINALAGIETIRTQGIREDDAKGRHTTTRRQLHVVPGGCLVLDTPGMRELQLTDAASGIEDLFADLHQLSSQCKFGNCQHVTEPGCAVLQALESGEIDERRLKRWRKLLAEEALNSATLAERRSKDKAFGKMVRQVIKQQDKRKWDKG